MRYIVSKTEENCACCGKLTDLFEINLDKRICSKECFEKLKK